MSENFGAQGPHAHVRFSSHISARGYKNDTELAVQLMNDTILAVQLAGPLAAQFVGQLAEQHCDRTALSTNAIPFKMISAFAVQS